MSRKMKVKAFSAVISANDKRGYQEFVDKVYAFCERFKNSEVVHEGQSSAVSDQGKIRTCFTFRIEYELNGS